MLFRERKQSDMGGGEIPFKGPCQNNPRSAYLASVRHMGKCGDGSE